MRHVFKSISRGLKQAICHEKRRRTNRDERGGAPAPAGRVAREAQ
jgi:hypothetical protein